MKQKRACFEEISVEDIYLDSCDVTVIHNTEHDIKGCEHGNFVLLSSPGDMMYTPTQARELAAAIITAANHAEGMGE